MDWPRRSDAHSGSSKRLFKRRFSLTVSDYIMRVRLEHADELLCRGFPIAAVALKVGYRKTATFRARFRRYFGSGPTPSIRRSDTRPVPALDPAPRGSTVMKRDADWPPCFASGRRTRERVPSSWTARPTVSSNPQK